MKVDHIINAFNLGLKFYRGMCLLAQDRAQSEIATKLNSEKDGEHWVTVNAENGNGQHVLLSGEGRVLAGMGGKFTGVKIDKDPPFLPISSGAHLRLSRRCRQLSCSHAR